MRSRSLPETSSDFSFKMRPSCRTLSNALEISKMGLVSTLFGIAMKQRLLLGYAFEIPAVTAVRENSGPSLSSGSTQLTLKWEKIAKSSEKSNDH